MPEFAEVEKHHYAEYLQKAEEFFRGVNQAIQVGDWNRVGLDAIHCVISASDALCAYHLGKRSTSERHQDAAKLIQRLPLSSISEKSKQFLEVLNLKNKFEYQHHLTREKEAMQLAKQTERFYWWAKANLPKP